MLQTNHLGSPFYILNFVHVILHLVALFCLTVMWTAQRIFIEIINFEFGWQLIPILCLWFTLLVSAYVCFGGLTDRPVLGSWPKQRIEIIYAIGLAALLLSVGLQTWIMFPAWYDPFFQIRYLIACITTWILLFTWIAFLVLHLLRVRN
ncbi:hypothetical protein PFISCL1PPCAC_146 [Pristionchus fissidentatus]|uniref:Uncharacterized protein n=1 Tax=Pristionchus fissidentatus TaxID=1538716 RepID=A0AAV5URA3_9BILA|nr:hypothetical protein PFISCL1PPCAC_146 [Pristionchus fissidentatus]